MKNYKYYKYEIVRGGLAKESWEGVELEYYIRKRILEFREMMIKEGFDNVITKKSEEKLKTINFGILFEMLNSVDGFDCKMEVKTL